MKQKIVLIVSIVVGLLAAVLTRTYLASKDAEYARMKANFTRENGVMDVIVYKKDLPAGTQLTMKDVGILAVPEKGLRGQAIPPANVKSIVGRRILTSHKEAEVVFWSDIEGGTPLNRTLAGDIRRQMRAISVNCSGAAAVSGMVRPADHVDVIGTFSFPDKPDAQGRPTQKFVTCTILQNVLVLATGRETAKSVSSGTGTSGAYNMVTLEVTPREAEMLVFAEQIHGRITLTLRNPNDVSYENELPKVDFEKIQSEIEELNLKRQENLKAH
ncbi:MAG: Flp pilus assembly protein CpaB [Kiritimatiellae bacterium]|nr:Flp pilus assembly protein CpaB [Kiritimatiellia bacterium]